METKKAFPGREGLAVNNDNKSPSPGRRAIIVIVIILDQVLHAACMIIKKAFPVCRKAFFDLFGCVLLPIIAFLLVNAIIVTIQIKKADVVDLVHHDFILWEQESKYFSTKQIFRGKNRRINHCPGSFQ